MSRQITIKRTELGLGDLTLNDPTNGYFVGDDWVTGGVEWQRYTASPSPWVYGDRVVAQRQTGTDETFLLYVRASTPSGLKAKIQTIATALGQYRYEAIINWDGATYTFVCNGAGDLRYRSNRVDPILHQAGWTALEITLRRDPGLG